MPSPCRCRCCNTLVQPFSERRGRGCARDTKYWGITGVWQDLGLKGKRKFQRKGVLVCTGTAVGTEGEQGVTSQDVQGSARAQPSLVSPTLGSWGLLSSGGWSAGQLLLPATKDMLPGTARGTQCPNWHLAPRLLSVAPLPGKHCYRQLV